MADNEDKRIGELEVIDSFSGSELFVVEKYGVAKSTTAENFSDYVKAKFPSDFGQSLIIETAINGTITSSVSIDDVAERFQSGQPVLLKVAYNTTSANPSYKYVPLSKVVYNTETGDLASLVFSEAPDTFGDYTEYSWRNGESYYRSVGRTAITTNRDVTFADGVNVSVSTEPTEDEHVTNKAYVDQAISHASSMVASVNGKTGDVVLKASDIENDAGYITEKDLPGYESNSKLSGSGTLTDDHVRAMLDVAETWFNRAYTSDGEYAHIVYQAGDGPYYLNPVHVVDRDNNDVWGPAADGLSYLVCSQFCQLLLNGITYENSRSNLARYFDDSGELMRGLPYYAKRAEPNIMLPWAFQWDATYLEYANSSGDDTSGVGNNAQASIDNRFLLAGEQAHYAYDHGFGFAIGERPLRPGDFVYVPGDNRRFMGIGHCALVVQVSDDQSTVLVAQSGGAETGGGMKKDGKHTGVNMAVFPVSHYNYAARFPLGIVAKSEPILAFADKTVKKTGDTVTYTYYTRDYNESTSSWDETPHTVTDAARAASYSVALQKGFYTILLDTDITGLYCVSSHGENIKRRYPTFFANGQRKIMTIYIEEETDALWIMGTYPAENYDDDKNNDKPIRGVTIVKGYASERYRVTIAGTANGTFEGTFSGSRKPSNVVTLSGDTIAPINALHDSAQNFSEYIATIDGYTNTEDVSSWSAMPGRAVWFLTGRKNYAGQGVQRITSYVTAFSNREWIRSCINGNWTAWREIGGGS